MTILHHVVGRAVYAIGGALVLLALVFRHDDPTAADTFAAGGKLEAATEAKYRFDTRYLAGQRDGLLHRAARLAQDSIQSRQTRDSLLREVGRLLESVDSLHRQPLTPAVRRYAEACGDAINTCTERAGLLAQALETEHARANLATMRAAHADSVIAQGVRAQTCHFLLVLGCVSRAHAAELGLLGGVILTLVVRH